MSEDIVYIRLNKAISDTGICSRREADKLIEQGKVTVNGNPVVLGLKVCSSDVILVDGKQITVPEKTVYIAFNKPKGITCTTELKIEKNIIDYINFPQRIFPIGRLDKASEGLIFLTSDGNIVNKILRAGNNHEKEYIVTVNKPITAEFVKRMANGIPILDTVTQKCFVKKESLFVFRIVLTQGLNRQIRRMCEYLGFEVVKLVRVRIMNITIDGIATGTWRHFTEAELSTINELVATSIKTEEASIQLPNPE
ncbi:MAG: 23S rRNA pseudouridine(2604) synthase RluF [Bacteroidetes bacterium]|nr:23S rRNA pseudouridine(2604) synthase RluF [Bacteroidota bacterium]